MNISKNNRPVIVGVFILVGIAILMITIFTIGNKKNTFVQSITIKAIFKNINGLIIGGNVWFSGVKIGTVDKILFYENSDVEVTMSIERDVQSHIHKNACAKIGSDGLIGNKIVIIYGGNSTMPQVEENDFLVVHKSLNTDDMLTTLQANNKNLLEITKNFKSISNKINNGNGLLAVLVNDSVTANKFYKTMYNLDVTVSNFKSVSIASRNVLSDIQSLSGKINKPGNAIHDLVSDTQMYVTIKGTLSKLENSVDALSKFTTNLKTVGEKLKKKDNIAGVLFNDSASAGSLKITLKNLETSSQKLDADLEALQHNFLLKGFFRKKEKARAKKEKDSILLNSK